MDKREKEERDRERERVKRDKERRENIPSAYKKGSKESHGGEKDQGSTSLTLVPYEDDSEEDTNTGGQGDPPRERVSYHAPSRSASYHGSRPGSSRSRDGGYYSDTFRSSSRQVHERSMSHSDRSLAAHGDRSKPFSDRERGFQGDRGMAQSDRRISSSDCRSEPGKHLGSRDRRSLSPFKVKTEPGLKEPDYSKLTPEEIIEAEKKVWIRSAPADLYYTRDRDSPGIMRATTKCLQLQQKFEEKLVTASKDERAKHPVEEPPRFRVPHTHKHDGDDSSSSESDDENQHNHRVESLEWLEFRSKASNRAHSEVWQNMEGELNDGPACRCSKKARETGIRHGIYVGETELPVLDKQTNNWDKLYHYRVTISPPTNFLIKHPTIIHHDEHEFIFEGFSMFTVEKIPDLPVCKVVRFNIEYNILYFEEKMPENFTVSELDLFHQYFFYELLELWDWAVDGRFYFMPRFVRDLSENGKEILSMNEVIAYMLNSYTPLIEEMDLVPMTQMSQSEWQHIADRTKGMLVTFPGHRPSTLRVDQLDREQDSMGVIKYPDIVHFGIRPPQLSYAGSQDYQKAWREFVKFRHLLANMAKPTFKDRRELEAKEHALQEMRSNSKLKRDCTAVISAQGYHKTGLMTDIVQHAMLLPVLVNHLRLHNSLQHLETRINYKFKNRYLLQQAVTHPSYKENFGTNPDHIRNTLSNCGIRQPEYGDKKIHYQNTRKRGINMLINIMSRFGKKIETESKVQHNERLEFLGDAVVEFITSVHLFYMFPDLEEGGLATYRAAIVQNQHLAILASGLGLDKYMLYAHGSDLCHDSELRHAMANCFEALMGAIFLDGGIDLADRVFGDAMFGAEPDLWSTWKDLPHHPLQTQEPGGDRHWVQTFPVLKKMVEFEELTGIEFTHIRLLARAFTDRSIGFNNLTLGSNQRMEFLGDTVLQLITSDFLYKHFPDHHEGHLSLLRSSLVNNRTQSVVCDDLGMTKYAVYANPKGEIKVKDKADLLEAFLGALYVDKDLEWCQVFAHVCFFPRLQQFILNQDWNDPKSKLQQCCLTLRTMDGGEPDIPVYKIIECKGPTNTRVYTVAVYFRGERLAKDHGHSIQQAEMNAAKIALEKCAHLFPHLNYQKRIMERSFKRQGVVGDIVRDNWYQETLKKRQELGMDKEPEVKQEISVDEKPEFESDQMKQELGETSAGLTATATKQSGGKDNKDAVRAEIKEIENKLLKRKQKKSSKNGGVEIEDGECIDSEEDFDKIDKVEKVVDPSSFPTAEEVCKKKKEENKKRWAGGEQSKGSDRDQGGARTSEERGREKTKPRYSPSKRDTRESTDSNSKNSVGRGGGYSYSSRGRDGGGRRGPYSHSQHNSGGNYRNNYYDHDQRQYRY